MLLLAAALGYCLLVLHFAVGMARAFACHLSMDLPPIEGPLDDLPTLSVVVPVRDEEANLVGCLEALARQEYPAGRLQLILVDDHSSDRTPLLAAGLAAAHPSLEVLRAPPLPPGWTGKNHACHVGAARAAGEWICFMDADTRALPRLLGTTVAHAVDHQADLLSLSPLQRLETAGERLVMPFLFLAIAATMDFRRLQDPAAPEAVANGQFMLFRRSAYEALGGHAAVRGVVHEDLALAAATKAAGLRLAWAFGESLLSTRMYRSVAEIWAGFSKNMCEIMGVPDGTRALGAALYHGLLGGLGPAIVAGAGWGWDMDPWNPWAFRIAAAAVGIVAGIAAGALRELRVPVMYAAAFPIGFTFHGLLILASQWQRQRGRRTWKGRAYP